MPFIINTLLFIVQITSTILNLYSYVVIASCLVSWVNPDPYNPIVRFLYRITHPAFNLIKKYLPFTVISGFDLSPIVLLIGIQFANQVIAGSIMQIIRSL